MKQISMFGSEQKEQGKYTDRIEAPTYQPKGVKPHVLELCDTSKTNRLIQEIERSDLPDEEKQFLKLAAQRHTVFNYERIADYYANASPEMQNLMERSALVIIDFEKAIQLGYVKLCDDIRKQYLEEYGQ